MSQSVCLVVRPSPIRSSKKIVSDSKRSMAALFSFEKISDKFNGEMLGAVSVG